MRRALLSMVAVMGLTGIAGGAFGQDSASQSTPETAPECGAVSIASLNWKSARVLAQIDRIILSEGYGCEVELVPGDATSIFSSMDQKSEPDIAPEIWIDPVRDALDKAVDEGRLVVAAKALADGGVAGWWIPKYVTDQNPEIKTIEDALKRPDLFPAPGQPSKGAVHSCPAGSGCETVTENLFKAFKAEEKGFVLVEPGSVAGLDGSIANALVRKEGWLGYYWEPSPLLGKYEMVRLDEGIPHDPEAWEKCIDVAGCADPKPNAWRASEVVTVITKGFAEKATRAADYVWSRKLDNDTVNGLLARMADEGESEAESAEHFLRQNVEVWTAWVSEDAADRIRKALRIKS